MDLIPFLIFKTESGQVEFAQWRTQAGDAALAVFQDRAKAETFIQVSSLGEAWTVDFQSHDPSRSFICRLGSR
jgi:hypothetical protein